MNLIDVIVLLVVIVLAVLVVRKLIKNGNCCSCGCSNCPYNETCKRKK